MLSLVLLQSRRAATAAATASARPFSSASKRWVSTTDDDNETKIALRALLRETAQPVAVATSFYPLENPDAGASGDESAYSIAGSSKNDAGDAQPHPRFHGATLSSFASIAMDPHPLVAFSLRIPSRLAAALKASLPSQSQHPTDPDPQPRRHLAPNPNIVINLLSNAQAPTAARFAHPRPGVDPFAATPHVLSVEGLPVLRGALGALSCALVSCTPLHELCDGPGGLGGVASTVGSQSGEAEAEAEAGGVISELFILRVVRVERTLSEGEGRDKLPLVYHRRRYATILPTPES